MFISGQCAKKFKNSFLRRNIYTKLQKYRSKNPPPRHFSIFIQKIQKHYHIFKIRARCEEIYKQSNKNIGQKIPPPKFLHFYAENAKILAYMQNKGPFCIYFA